MARDPVDHQGESTASPEQSADGSGLPFPLVGVGASAGGLEAFEELLTNLPAEPGLAMLFVLHLEPHRKSHLVEVLSRWTQLTVREAEDGMKVEANNLYLIPPNKVMTLADGRLSLAPRPAYGQQMPIDHLFRSLAEVRHARAIGVILSGGGTDGTLGFQAIRGQGGITFAQDEKTALCDSMPRSAILDGNVDFVLPPREIARQLVRVVRHPYTRETGEPGPTPEIGDATPGILQLLRTFGSVDFSQYKRTTVLRRIHRRMALRGLDQVEAYLHVLKEDQRELRNLFQDLLVPVTQFFRDPEVFEVLQQSVFPALLENRTPDQPIRIWSAGCSTGEEAYSLAIALLEVLSQREQVLPVKILATDVNEALLERARAGVYLDNITVDVSPERLRRFFVRGEGKYQISKAVRDLCIFSRHNLATDPPFAHLDLVSCRNVLIYMGGPLQQRVLAVLHYALNANGFLLLGSSESVGPFGDLFTTVGPRHRLYRKKAAPVPAPLKLHFGAQTSTEDEAPRGARAGAGPLWSTADVQKEADRIVLNHFAPAGVVVDEAMTVLQFRGQTSPYLELPSGRASFDLVRMLREGMLADVRDALAQAKKENVTTFRDNVRVVEKGTGRAARVEVIPFKVPPAGARFFLVLFTPQQPAAPAVPAPPAVLPSVAEQQAAQLQQEMGALREYLRSVVEERECTDEKLRSANEEVLSANEELQSTNEELQTAKEEAQSANEELTTVNEELRRRNAELAGVNEDLVSILSGVTIPIVMVGHDLRIRRFTPAAEKVFNLIPTDVGRPISDIKSNLNVSDLGGLVADVITTLRPYDALVTDREGHPYSLRARPYVTRENKVEGASVVLIDIEAIKGSVGERGAGAEGTCAPQPLAVAGAAPATEPAP